MNDETLLHNPTVVFSVPVNNDVMVVQSLLKSMICLTSVTVEEVTWGKQKLEIYFCGSMG
jgi:hypothetical protein